MFGLFIYDIYIYIHIYIIYDLIESSIIPVKCWETWFHGIFEDLNMI